MALRDMSQSSTRAPLCCGGVLREINLGSCQIHIPSSWRLQGQASLEGPTVFKRGRISCVLSSLLSSFVICGLVHVPRAVLVAKSRVRRPQSALCFRKGSLMLVARASMCTAFALSFYSARRSQRYHIFRNKAKLLRYTGRRIAKHIECSSLEVGFVCWHQCFGNRHMQRIPLRCHGAPRSL